MTDEEKAEKLNELMNRISFALKDATLAQGFEIICKRISELEKENKISEEIIIGEQQEIKQLEKENAELFNSVTELTNSKTELENKITELKKDKEYLANTDNEQTEVILKLYEQIEKMKCCGNCKHYEQKNNYVIGTCKEKYDIEGNNTCDNWEMAE